MNLAPIAVTGKADRRLVACLREVSPLLDELGTAVLVIGGLMTRLWLHAQPIGLPVRPTADVDIGVDRRALRLAGDRRVVGPLLKRLGFDPGYEGEPFRYSKEIEGVGLVVVDVMVAPGASRDDPPIVERGLETVAAPGLAYAMLRPTVLASTTFVEGEETSPFDLPIPTLDAAFVLKAALAESGVRTRPDRVRSDTVDALMLAAACLGDPSSLTALRDHGARSDVRKSIRWTQEVFRSSTALGSRRVEDHFSDEGYGAGTGAWAHQTAQALLSGLRPDADPRQ